MEGGLATKENFFQIWEILKHTSMGIIKIANTYITHHVPTTVLRVSIYLTSVFVRTFHLRDEINSGGG